MALKPYATSASVSFSTGVTICSVEVVPDGADLDVKIFGGTDNTGTLKYRILAREKASLGILPIGVAFNSRGHLISNFTAVLAQCQSHQKPKYHNTP